MSIRIFSLPSGFPREAAFFDGHFPGNPIVPGAVLLGWLSNQLSEEGLVIARIVRMKFLRPHGAAEPLEVAVTREGNSLEVEFRGAGGVVAKGLLEARLAP